MKSYKIETLEFLTTEDKKFIDFMNKIKDPSQCEEIEILDLCEPFSQNEFYYTFYLSFCESKLQIEITKEFVTYRVFDYSVENLVKATEIVKKLWGENISKSEMQEIIICLNERKTELQKNLDENFYQDFWDDETASSVAKQIEQINELIKKLEVLKNDTSRNC